MENGKETDQKATGPTAEDLFRQDFELLPVPRAQADLSTGRLLKVNRAMCELTGYSEAELLERTFSDITHPDDRDKDWAAFQRMCRGEELSYRSEKRYVHKNGRIVWVDARAVILASTEGFPRRTTAIIQDISAAKEAQEALRKSEERYRFVFEQTTVGIAQADLTGRFVLANDYYCQIVGWSRDELVTKRMQDITHPEDLVANLPLFKRCVQEGIPFTIDKRYHRPDGSVVWVNNTVSLIRGADGSPQYVQAVTIDLTQRKQAEEALRIREDRYRELFSSMGEGFCVIEEVDRPERALSDFRYVEANPAFYRETGLGDVIGKAIREVVPLEADHWIKIFSDVMHSGEPVRMERELITLGRTFEIHAYRVGQDNPRRVGVLFRDVTERRRAEDQLRRNQETFYHLIQNNPFGLHVVDADFRLRQISLGAQKVFSNVRPLLGRDFAEVMRLIWDEPFASETIDRYRHTLETGEPYTSTSTIERRRDIGEVAAYDWRIERVTLPDGRHGVVCYFYDLSERQQWEAVLRRSEERFYLAAKATNDAIWDWHIGPDTIWWNEGMEILFGASPEHQVGDLNWWSGQLHPDDRERVQESLHTAVAGKAVFWRAEYRFRRADGRYAEVFDRGYVVRNEAGKAVRMIGAIQDLTERKEAEAALAKAREELQKHATALERTVAERTAKLRETVAELEHFSYTIAHDMRAPLRALRAFGEILAEEYYSRPLDAEGRGYLARITAAAARMDSLVTDALNYTKAVQTELMLEPVEPGSLIAEIVASYPQFHERGATIIIEGEFPRVLGNRAGLTQCFSNLLDNGVKFVTPGREPAMRVWAEPRGAFVRIWFEDNGIGVPEDQHERIFEMFQQLTKSYSGTGMGLALVRKVIQRMQGRVGLESAVGEGSRFWLELKVAAA